MDVRRRTTTEAKLKPCPFCGCAYEKDPDDFYWAGDHEEGCPLSNTFPTSTTNITVSNDLVAIELWNKRAPQWVSVKDQLPEEHCFVLVAYSDKEFGRDVGMGMVHNGKLMLCDGLAKPGSMTHWMPLPEPPEE